ncbi:hypothetical protein BH20ACI1_BH20ACI1_04490 [soil metagenome]
MISSPVAENESRRIQRISLTLPIRVESHVNETTVWNEVTRLNDVSAFGAGFNLSRPVKRGRLLQMTIPMPRKLRSFDFSEPQYKVWGLVRSCITKNNGSAPNTYAVGTAFIGKNPPKNYYNDPAMLFDISHRNDESMWHVINAQSNPDESTLPKELRRHSRYSIPANVIVEIVDSEGNVQASEPTFTENLSLSGAALFTTLAAEVGSFVRVKSEQYNVSIIAVVRGRRNGQDGIPRLHIEFVDRFFPLEGIV